MTYTVQAGDSLYDIAQRFNTSVQSIIQANRLTSPNLYIGQQLFIPTQTPQYPTGQPPLGQPPMGQLPTSLFQRLDRLENRMNRLERRVNRIERHLNLRDEEEELPIT